MDGRAADRQLQGPDRQAPDVDIDPLGGLRRRIEIALLPEVESAVTGDRCSANVQVGNGSV